MEAPHNSALLIFRVGPVLCAAPSLPIVSIVSPPKLSHPPGSSPANPGIFYHAEHVVSVTDLRYQFGLDESKWIQPGRLIITEADGVYDALWVDDIIEVIEAPKEGWGPLPALLPQKIFSHTLLIDDQIHLYTELRQLVEIDESGVLRQYIEKLQQNPEMIDGHSSDTPTEEKPPVVTSSDNEDAATKAQHTAAAPEEIDKPETTAQDEVAAADEISPLATLATTLESDPAAAATTAQARDEVEPTASESLSVEPPPHELENESATTADESIDDATATERETTEEMVTEEDIAPVMPPDTGQPKIDDTVTSEVEESIPNQATLPVEEAVSTDNISEQKPAPAHIKTEIDNRLIIDDEPDIPLILDEDVHGNDTATIVTDRDIYRAEKSKLTIVIVTLVAILLLTAIGGGLYYFFITPDKIVTSTAIKAAPDNSAKVETRATDTATEKAIEVVEEKPPETPPSNDYHADIKPDKEGITIVLHTPKGEPVLREEATATVKEDVEEKITTPTKKTVQKTKNKNRNEVIHIVVKGDTLWAIAEHYVKDPYRYPELARLSKIKNPDRIYPGNRVRIINKNSHP